VKSQGYFQLNPYVEDLKWALVTCDLVAWPILVGKLILLLLGSANFALALIERSNRGKKQQGRKPYSKAMSKNLVERKDSEIREEAEDKFDIEAPRIKTSSDLTGLKTTIDIDPSALPQDGSHRRKTVSDISDMVIVNNLPPEARKPRRRQKSSSDVIAKFGQAPVLRYDDLRMAEEIAAAGTRRVRQKSGVSDEDFHEKIEEEPEAFDFNDTGLTSKEAEELLKKYGRNELPEKADPKWLIFLRQFWAPMPIMIWLAVIIEIGIGNYIDMGILLLILFANASISFYETNKAGNAIAALKSSLKPSATCKRDGEWKVIDAAILVPGDTVLLGSGSAIPADCRVNEKEIDVDQAALTGESLPVTFYRGDSVKMGSTVVRGEVCVRTV
jgi:H+-transporting ATPase